MRPSEDDLRGRPPLPPALVDREHLYDGGGVVECPRCVTLETEVEVMEARAEAAEMRSAQLEQLVRDMREAIGSWIYGRKDIRERSYELVP